MTLDSSEIDPLDRLIIGILSNRGRISWRDLGDEIGLSPSSTADRVRRLELRGIITGYSARVDPEFIGRGLRAVVDVRLGPHAEVAEWERHLASEPAVQSAVHVTGPFDYLLHVACTGVAELDRVLRSWKARFGGETSTRIMLHELDLPAMR
jgi:Lrp/AsnC family leucine-responsive transcriptional regulator